MNQLKPLLNFKSLINFQRHNRPLNLSLFIAYAFLITGLSLTPHVSVTMVVTFQDKIHHIIAYSTFTLLAWRIARTPKTYLVLALCLFIYGILIEILQTFTGRFLSGYDVIANGIGIGLTLWLIPPRSLTTND